MRLLIVDDHPPLVASLFSYFEARDAHLDAAPDGIVGLHLAMTQAYDAIVLDWMLPRMEGPAVLRALREQGVDTPVLMLTARDRLPDKLAGFRAGADDYLTKPFDLPELEVRLTALLARARGRGAAKVLSVGDLEFDLSTLEVRRGGRLLHLFPLILPFLLFLLFHMFHLILLFQLFHPFQLFLLFHLLLLFLTFHLFHLFLLFLLLPFLMLAHCCCLLAAGAVLLTAAIIMLVPF